MNFANALSHLLQSKEAKEMAPFIPYGSFALGTLDKLNNLVHDAKEGDPGSLQAVREIKARSNAGDPTAKQAVKTMQVISKKQTAKKSFYAKGMMSVGHDPMTIGAVRDQRGGASGGGGVTVTTSLTPRGSQPAQPARKGPVIDWRSGKRQDVSNFMRGSPWQGFDPRKVSAPLTTVLHPTGAPLKVSPFPTEPPATVDPYAQDPYAQDPYGGYPVDPYATYSQYGYPPFFDPYGYPQYPLPGMPPGYGYPGDPSYGYDGTPVVDKGGYQQYDESTDSFYSSNQKQVYDEATGMFIPVSEPNPYNPYGF